MSSYRSDYIEDEDHEPPKGTDNTLKDHSSNIVDAIRLETKQTLMEATLVEARIEGQVFEEQQSLHCQTQATHLRQMLPGINGFPDKQSSYSLNSKFR